MYANVINLYGYWLWIEKRVDADIMHGTKEHVEEEDDEGRKDGSEKEEKK